MEEPINEKTNSRLKRIENWVLNHPIGFLLVVFCSILLLFIAYWAIWSDISPEWTGFGEHITPNGEFVRHKTLWDWMELLIVPIVLALGAFWFNLAQKKTELAVAKQARITERAIAKERQQQAIIEAYYDRMTDLLIRHGLRESKHNGEKRSVARSRTLSVLRSLDGDRRGQILRFLIESRLLDYNDPIVDLQGADFTGADLQRAQLYKLELSGAILDNAIFRNSALLGVYLREVSLKETDFRQAKMVRATILDSNFWHANLCGSDLSNATLGHIGKPTGENNFRMANMRGAILRSAYLDHVNFSETNLEEANLEKTVLKSVNFNGANLTDTKFSGAFYDKNTSWPKGYSPQSNGASLIEPNMDLSNKDFSEMNFQNSNLSSCNLSGTNLENTNLEWTNFENANLTNANLSHANLKYANFEGANLANANLSYAQNWEDSGLLLAASLNGATMPDGSIYDEWIKLNLSRVKTVITEAREISEEIDALKNDLDSEFQNDIVYEMEKGSLSSDIEKIQKRLDKILESANQGNAFFSDLLEEE